jgi:hypothetical protein
MTFRGWRHAGVVLIAATALLGAGVTTAGAETFTGSCNACVAGYSGTFTEKQISTDPNPSNYEVTTTIKLSWSQQLVNNGNGTSTAQPETVSGMYTTTSDEPHFQGSSCQIGPNPGEPSLLTWSYLNMNQASAVYDVDAQPPGSVDLSGTGPCSGTTDANITNLGTYTGMGCHWGDNDGILTQIPPGGPFTETDDCLYQSANNGTTIDATATDSLTWQSASGSSTGSFPTTQPGTPGPQFTPAKNQARGDLIRTVKRSTVYCLDYVGGAGLAGTGILVGGVAGTTFTIAGGLITAAMNPLCGPAIARVVVDYKTFKDPPLYSIDVLARPASVRVPKLPACRRDVRFCDTLRKSLGALDKAALGAEADTAAIEQTVSREHAAVLAGNQSAANAQDRDLRSLEPALSAAQRAETSAGRSVAKVLRGAHLAFRLSRAQSARERKKVAAAIVRRGATVAQVTAVDRSAFTGAKTNLLSVLGS